MRRVPLEECDISVFDEMEAGDILFFDGSHRVFQNSDVVVFFFGNHTEAKARYIGSHSRYLLAIRLSTIVAKVSFF